MSEGPTSEATPRIEVVAGGTPTAEQLAALVVAMTPTGAEPRPEQAAASGWAEAALLEGVGFRPFHSYVDLDRYHRSIA